MSLIIKLDNFSKVSEQQKTPAQKTKDLQAKANIDKELLEINKRISDIDLAIANLAKREKDGSLSRSESFKQQAVELQKKVAEYSKKSVSLKKMEDITKK